MLHRKPRLTPARYGGVPQCGLSTLIERNDMKRSLIAAALLAAATAPAYAAIPHVGDETDLSWQYTAPTAKPFFADAPATLAKAPVRIGDENDTSWIYTPAARP